MIFHTLTHIQAGKPYQLQSYIDNRESDKAVGLRSLTYWVGWYNVKGKQYIATKNKRIDLEPGLYNFSDLKDIFSNEGTELSVNKTNGLITLEIPPSTEIQLSSGILSLLGIVSKHGRLAAGRHTGDKIVDFAQPKELRIYLDQINTATNYVNGAPSTLLTIIPVSDRPFGKAVACRFECPVFKKLINGCITELSVRITDENDTVLNNHGLPITVELLI